MSGFAINPDAPSGKSILLVEDSPDDELIFLDVIRKSGIPNPVIVVHDGAEAVACLRREGRFADPKKYPRPSSAFIDLKLPKISGFEVLRWIKAQPHLKDLLCIVLTHYNESKEINKAYALGAHSFLTKPPNVADLCNLALHFHSHFDGFCNQEFPTSSSKPGSSMLNPNKSGIE